MADKEDIRGNTMRHKSILNEAMECMCISSSKLANDCPIVFSSYRFPIICHENSGSFKCS